MTDKLFVLITVLGSGVFSLIVTIATNWGVGRRELLVFWRQQERDELVSRRKLYEEVTLHLDRLTTLLDMPPQHKERMGATFDATEGFALKSRLLLRAPIDVVRAYDGCVRLLSDISGQSPLSQVSPRAMMDDPLGRLILAMKADLAKREALLREH